MIAPLTIRVIDGAREDAATKLRELRAQLSPSGDVVSAQGRQRTIEAFGEPLTPRQVVDRICSDVARRGLDAVIDHTRRIDRAELTPETIRVSAEQLQAAHRAASPDYLATIRRIRQNIMTFQSAILHQDAVMPMSDHELRLIYRPLARVGVCIPGGAAAYPSTVLMTVAPAQAAGVRDIALVAPPTPNGANNPDLLACCHELGITEIYRIGGAQAVAALAYGVEGIPPVDKIVGPGNLFVALAKQKVSEVCGIDMMAGPSEVVVIADRTANPDFLAADLIAQAEHSPGASVLVTWARELVEPVIGSLSSQLARLPRGELARESLEQYGAIVIAPDEAEACRISDFLAPEHLQIQTADPEWTFRLIHHAGAVFLGHYTPVAVGDYAAGPSHTLPTGGAARFASGLSSNDFLKRSSVIHFSPGRLKSLADDIRLMAEKEGLTGHAESVDIRLRDGSPSRFIGEN